MKNYNVYTATTTCIEMQNVTIKLAITHVHIAHIQAYKHMQSCGQSSPAYLRASSPCFHVHSSLFFLFSNSSHLCLHLVFIYTFTYIHTYIWYSLPPSPHSVKHCLLKRKKTQHFKYLFVFFYGARNVRPLS